MHQILSRLMAFVGFVFLIVLATAAPLLAFAVLIGATAYALAEIRARQAPEPRRVRVRTEAPPRL